MAGLWPMPLPKLAVPLRSCCCCLVLTPMTFFHASCGCPPSQCITTCRRGAAAGSAGS